MNDNQEPLNYDEEEAVTFIKNSLPQELKDKFSDNDINYIIDIVYDFYEERGLMDENLEDEDAFDIDEEELTDYVYNNTKKDKIKSFTREEITFVIQGEISYCESIGLFE